MGFRFRKSIKLLPGVRLNLSKSGVSASVGQPGATVNFSSKGTRGTVGIPGSGLSYSQNLSKPVQTPAQESTDAPASDGSWLLRAIAALAVGIVLYGVMR